MGRPKFQNVICDMENKEYFCRERRALDKHGVLTLKYLMEHMVL